MLRSKAMSNFNVTTYQKIEYPFGSPLGKWTNPLIFGGTLQGPKVHAISRALVASWGLKPAAAANSATLRAIWALSPMEVTKIGGVLRQTSQVNEDTNISDTYLGVMRKYIGHKYIREYLGVMRNIFIGHMSKWSGKEKWWCALLKTGMKLPKSAVETCVFSCNFCLSDQYLFNLQRSGGSKIFETCDGLQGWKLPSVHFFGLGTCRCMVYI